MLLDNLSEEEKLPPEFNESSGSDVGADFNIPIEIEMVKRCRTSAHKSARYRKSFTYTEQIVEPADPTKYSTESQAFDNSK